MNKSEVAYFGVKFSAEGISPDTTKVEDLKAAEKPRNSKEALSFICMAQALCQDFVPKFSMLAAPIYKLTRKGEEFMWTEECQKAFDTIKEAITNTDSLVPYHPNRKTKLTVDSAMGIGTAASLWQQQDNGDWKPITHHSRTFSKPEKNYS